jgi:hypothetical protein
MARQDGKTVEVRAQLLSPNYEGSSSNSASPELNLLETIDKILDKGMVINGDITVAVGGADLLSLKINLVIASLETAKKYGIQLPWEKWQQESKQGSGDLEQESLPLRSYASEQIAPRPSNGKRRRQHR